MRLTYDDGSYPQHNGNIANQKWEQGLTFPMYLLMNMTGEPVDKGIQYGITLSAELGYDKMGNIRSPNKVGAGIST